MKNTILLITLLLTAPVVLCFSQNNSVYDNYIGTWKWEDNQTQSEFVVILKKGKADWTKFNGGIEDCIIGVYKYKINGTIVEDNTDELDEEKRYSMYPIVLLGDELNMSLDVRDYLLKNEYGLNKDMQGSSNVELVEGSNGTQMKWTIVDDGHQHIYTDEKQIFPKGTSLPTNIILIKEE